MRFNQIYNQEDFLQFLLDFLPEDFVPKEEEVVINKGRYKEIREAKLLGFCESLDLHVLEMDHSHENDPRITVATDAFKILADHWIHKALVIFKNKESENYRLSYLTIYLDLNEKNKVVRRYSNARRFSFYLGVNAKVRTPEQQLIKKGKVKDSEDLLNRFSVEVVNKQFYLEVAKYFDELVSGEKRNLVLPSVSQEAINTRKSFAVRLIGRLMFCWFLKQKKSASGQLIPNELLSSKVVGDNYYHAILEPLFFEVLNTSIESRGIRNELFDKVSYLNGGLFNPQSDDCYDLDRDTFTSRYINTLKISDSWFRGFFELLETYNFTIDENTVFDQELSVDPEMLGRIFENLLAEINPETGSSERKRTGSFYTPRQIVEYMVDQSLIEYFKTKTKIDEKKLAALVSYDLTDDAENPLNDKEKQEIISAIESLKILDPACGSGAYPIGALQKIVYVLQQIDPDCKLWLELKLKGVPELYKQKILNEFKNNPPNYIRKLEVIKNSIFGVDIQSIAVDVSRLRCFLTLVVESEVDDTKPNRGIEPLPNLDFKFVCANTLIGLPKPKTDNLFEDQSGITELSGIMSEYFSCSSQRKNEIKLKFSNTQKEILNKALSAYGRYMGELTRELTLWDPFNNKSNSWFDPQWMFGLEEKFDVVIGNPPYVGHKGGQKKLFRYLKNTELGNRFNNERMDLFYYFFHLALSLSKNNATVFFITTNYYLTADSAIKLRSDFKNRATILRIVDFNELKIFDSAQGQHNILTFLQNGVTQRNCYIMSTLRSGIATQEILENILDEKDEHTIYSNVNQKDLYDGAHNYIRISNRSGESQTLISNILSRLSSHNPLLSTLCNISQGIVSGVDKITQRHVHKNSNLKDSLGTGVYVLNDSERSQIGQCSVIRPWFKNSDISKYSANEINTQWLIHLHSGLSLDLFPNVKEHLQKYQTVIKSRNYDSGELSKAKRLKAWWALSSSRKDFDFTQPKIVSPQRSNRNIFAYTEREWLASADVYFVTSKTKEYSLKYIMALLNSKVYYLWFYHRGKRKGKMLELYLTPLSNVPVKQIPIELQKPFIQVVDQILTIKKQNKDADTKGLEHQIDTLVYELYGLTDEEIKIVENN